MSVTTPREDHNHKLDWLIYLWQDTFHKNHHTFPTHIEFFHYCHIFFTKSYSERLKIFKKYALFGIDSRKFIDKNSQMCKEFFVPILSLLRDVTGSSKNKLPRCKDIFILGEALEHCDAETYKIICYTYGFSGISESLSLEEEVIISALRNHKRKAEIESVMFQYQEMKKQWKIIPFWISFLNDSYFI